MTSAKTSDKKRARLDRQSSVRWMGEENPPPPPPQLCLGRSTPPLYGCEAGGRSIPQTTRSNYKPRQLKDALPPIFDSSRSNRLVRCLCVSCWTFLLQIFSRRPIRSHAAGEMIESPPVADLVSLCIDDAVFS